MTENEYIKNVLERVEKKIDVNHDVITNQFLEYVKSHEAKHEKELDRKQQELLDVYGKLENVKNGIDLKIDKQIELIQGIITSQQLAVKDYDALNEKYETIKNKNNKTMAAIMSIAVVVIGALLTLKFTGIM